MIDAEEFDAFRRLSARLGGNPLRVQGPGGNTSIKYDNTMWIKASGTELADAQRKDIFVAVNRRAAKAEIDGAGDGSCKDTVIDPSNVLRPSIETTFHAALDWRVVAHTHSVATLVHAISPEGRAAAAEKLADLPTVLVPYAKPGLPLTREILARVTPETQVIILENHGLICASDSVADTEELIEEVERRLTLPDLAPVLAPPKQAAPDGFTWAEESWLAQVPRAYQLATAGTYYPDHVVFLGPALPVTDYDQKRPALIIEDWGVAIRKDATPSQRAMLRCLSDVLGRLPMGWQAVPIGPEAEATLLNWDAEKYRQALAAQS